MKACTCRKINLAYTVDITGRIDIGLKSCPEQTSFPFEIAQMQATFQTDGNCRFAIKEFMMLANGEAKYSATSISSFAGMWSGPVEQSLRRLCSSLRTSP